MLIQPHSLGECSFAVRIKRATATLFLLLAVPAVLSAQQKNDADTLHLSAPEAEKIFLEQNLPILAERLNIDQAEARILQAKTWPNPTFHLDGVQLYNKANTDPSPGLLGTDFWKNRTFEAQLEQMVKLAGKRKKALLLKPAAKRWQKARSPISCSTLKPPFARIWQSCNTSKTLPAT